MDDAVHPEPRRRIPILALLAANTVSQVGDLVAVVAIPWFVLETTGSAAKMGIAGAAIGVATVLAGVFGGPVVDRAGFRRTSVFADLCSGTCVALVPLLHAATGLAFWQLLLLVFLRSLLAVPGRAARRALTPELARLGGMPLERANAVSEAAQPLSFVVGPPLAAVLISTVGADNVLWLDAATFAASAALLALLVASPDVPKAGQRANGGSTQRYVAELAEGMRFVRRSRLLLSVALVATVANFLDDPLISVLLPVYSEAEYGDALGVGLMLGGWGAGSFAGTILYGAAGHRLPRRPTFLLAFVASGPLPYLALATTPPLSVCVVTFVIAGILGGPLNPLILTVAQEHTPRQTRGRVFGLLRAVVMAGTPFGFLLGGFVVEGVGLMHALIGMGICYLAVTLSMFFNPALRGMDKVG